jgi:hypothetical protein
MRSVIADIREEYVARYGTPRVHLVEAGRVRGYLLALNEPADLGSSSAERLWSID